MRTRSWFPSVVTNSPQRSFRLSFIAGLLLLFPGTAVSDIPRLTEQAAADIELARAWKPGVIGKAPPRQGGGSKFGQ